jgi:ATP-dependent exoDNAse (exonuclease V) beta subunit
LGFDVVILPNLNDETIPKKTHYGMIKSREGWVLQPPAFWVRCQIETLRRMEQEWENDQRYEAMCLLYVALTRARQGLYILLPEEPENRLKNPEEAESRASPANLVRRSISTDHFGNAEWAEGISLKEPKQETVEVELGPALPLLGRSTPSATKTSDGRMSFRSGAGMQIGSEVHALLEGISWLEPGEYPRMPRSQSGQHVEEALADPKIHALFENSPRDVELYREQPLEVIQDGKWMSGIVDRMHVCRGDDGAPRKITIIDYKTDAASAEEITAKYTAQMRCYQKAIVDIFGVGKEQVKCLIISTRNKAVIDLS